jgi:hypothetical protein
MLDSFSGLSFFFTLSVFSNMYMSCVLCTLCCQFLWIVLLHCPFGILTGHIHVREYRKGKKRTIQRNWQHRVHICIAPSVFPNIYLSCVMCTLCCQFLWSVHFHYPFGIFLTCICPVSCVPYVVREYRRGEKKGQSRETGKIGYTRHRTNKC